MRMRKWAITGLAVALLATGVGFGQPPTGGTATTDTGTTTGGTTDPSPSRALILAEMEELNQFVEMLVDEFGIVVEDEQQARQVVLVATHFYLWAKMEAFQQQGGQQQQTRRR